MAVIGQHFQLQAENFWQAYVQNIMTVWPTVVLCFCCSGKMYVKQYVLLQFGGLFGNFWKIGDLCNLFGEKKFKECRRWHKQTKNPKETENQKKKYFLSKNIQ